MITLYKPTPHPILLLKTEAERLFYYLSDKSGYRGKTLYESHCECLCCEGKGWFYDARDRDDYEGFKLAPRHTCHECNKGVSKNPPDPHIAAIVFATEMQKTYDKELSLYEHIRELECLLHKPALELLRKYRTTD